MLCQNCGKNEGNIKYTQIINGVKKQMILCEKCAQELGIENINFNMPIDFSSFLGDMIDEYESLGLNSSFIEPKELKCDKCNMSYEEFLNTGKFGCDNCYEVFKDKIDSLLKNIHGTNSHIGRISEKTNENIEIDTNKKDKIENENKIEKKTENVDRIEELKDKLKQQIKEEKYEDAAKTRDEIKKLENN